MIEASEARRREDGVDILIVEDDEIDAEVVRRAFARARVANPLHWARDGVEALEQLRAGGRWPTLVLLDLNMPRMNGIEFLEELRGDPRLASTVVFVLTTSDAERDKRAAYERHVAGFLVKSKMGAGFVNLIELLRDYCHSSDFPPEPLH